MHIFEYFEMLRLKTLWKGKTETTMKDVLAKPKKSIIWPNKYKWTLDY